MASPVPQSNEPLTPQQITCLRERISSLRKDYGVIGQALSKEKAKAAVNAAAIAHLEPAISLAKRYMETQEWLLGTMRQASQYLEKNEPPIPDWKEQSRAKELCQGITINLQVQNTGYLKFITHQISTLETHLLEARSQIRQMETEIYSERLMEAASLVEISSATDRHRTIAGNISLLQRGLNHVKNIPRELWVNIFRIRVDEDMEEHFINPGYRCISSTAMHLSHVCQFWRGIILIEKNIWRYLAVHPQSQWPPSGPEQLKHLRTLCPQHPNLLFDMSQYNRNGVMHNKHSRLCSAISNEQISSFDQYSMTMLVPGYGDHLNTALCPMRRPTSITLHLISPIHIAFAPAAPSLEGLLSPFTGFKSLEIVSHERYSASEFSLGTAYPQLTTLRLKLTTFDSFNISAYLGPNLTELHISHEGSSTFDPISTQVQLPKLRVLGITPPNTAFIQSLELPVLKGLVLYGPTWPERSTMSDKILVQVAQHPDFKRVRDLEVRNWTTFLVSRTIERPETTETKLDFIDIVDILRSIVNQMLSITVLRFVDSFVYSKLLDLTKNLMGLKSNMGGSKLETIYIDRCHRITRAQCSKLRRLVSKVEVYV